MTLRSEPFLYRLLGNQYDVTKHWCGEWGCSASLPRLLAWQLPMILTLVPLSWIGSTCLAFIRRNSAVVAASLAGATLLWVAIQTGRSWTLGQLHSATDVLRRITFLSVAGDTVVIPMLMASATICCVGRPSRDSGTNPDGRTGSEQTEDLCDVSVPHVNTAS